MASDSSFPVDERYSPPAHAREKSLVSSREAYDEMYLASIEDTEGFWSKMATETLEWIRPFSEVRNEDLASGQVSWFADGQINLAANCLDRHLPSRGDKSAIIWEGDEPGEQRTLTYIQLHREVCRFANGLRQIGVKRGDRVAVYMGMVPELAIAMLACARIGAVHSVIFGGFSAKAIADRVDDAGAKVVITQDEGHRGGKIIPLKATVDAAIDGKPLVEKVVVYKRSATDATTMREGRDIWWHDFIAEQSEQHEAQALNAEDPLFILYTSGSTGKPKGVLHTQAGYLLYTSLTHRYVFDLREDDVYCCAADLGWVTGHSYIVYGPLANGSTTVMFESTPLYPSASRYWEMVDKLGITILYTAPTAIRALMKYGDEPVTSTSRSTLRVLGTVGEPINPDAWRWYHKVVGDQRCAIVDTYWQTETGGHLITSLPGAIDTKPGSASLPFFGIRPVLLNDEGSLISENGKHGRLFFEGSWPGMMRTIYGDNDRFVQTYLSQSPGRYFSGDGAYRDKDGYYWITGRIDDVLNVSGHRIGTAEVEDAIVAHQSVVEAAVVGIPDDTKGEGIYAYVLLQNGQTPSDALAAELRQITRHEIGAFARPDRIQFVGDLPKTRSGKIMRRLLRKLAAGQRDELGDVSTLADSSVVDTIAAGLSETY